MSEPDLVVMDSDGFTLDLAETPEWAAEIIARVALTNDWGALQHAARVVHLLGTEATPEQKATGWLHDVLEDSAVCADDLRDCGIPETVVLAVIWLTRGREPYEEYVRALLTAPGPSGVLARRVKLADAWDNLSRCEEAVDVPKWRNLAEKRYRPLIAALKQVAETQR